MTSETAAAIDAVLAALRARQARGDAPPPGEVSHRFLAQLSLQINRPVSASTFRRFEADLLARIKAHLVREKLKS